MKRLRILEIIAAVPALLFLDLFVFRIAASIVFTFVTSYYDQYSHKFINSVPVELTFPATLAVPIFILILVIYGLVKNKRVIINTFWFFSLVTALIIFVGNYFDFPVVALWYNIDEHFFWDAIGKENDFWWHLNSNFWFRLLVHFVFWTIVAGIIWKVVPRFIKWIKTGKI